MIEITRKILKKLIDNINKYEVRVSSSKCSKNTFDREGNLLGNSSEWINYTIFFTDKGIGYIIEVDRNIITFAPIEQGKGIYVGSKLQTQLDEYYQYEILDLCQKLRRECENHTSTMFRNFADESDNEPDDDLE